MDLENRKVVIQIAQQGSSASLKCQFVTLHKDGSGDNCREDADYSLMIKSTEGNAYLVWVCITHNPRIRKRKGE